MSRILKRSSFGLLRTNPKLTTNVKLVVDSSGYVYLESIDANPSVARSIFKGYRVNPEGSYSYDLSAFWRQAGQLPKDAVYYLYERDGSTEIKDRYKNQFDSTYWAGVHPKNSRLYDEEYAAFAPLWLERDSVPDYFVVFKIDGPVSVNAVGASSVNKDTDFVLGDLASAPEHFFSNFVSGARVVTTFDLTERTAVGKYIRGHLNDASFPESPLYASMAKGNPSYWQGIAYDKGGFARRSEELWSAYTLPDKTVIEADDYITSGFQRNSVVCANLLNMEFLFDDTDQDKYKFSRYFGLYCSAAEIGKFVLDGSRLFADRDRESTQLLRPSMDIVGHPGNTRDQIQTNVLGVKLYPAVVLSSTGATGIASGRLVTLDEARSPRFPYVRDSQGRFYSVSPNSWWSDYTVAATGPSGSPIPVHDEHFVRLKDKKINLKTFTGFSGPYASVPATFPSSKGRPGFAFRIVDNPESGDAVRVLTIDPVGSSASVDGFTVIGDASLPEGQSSGMLWSVNGTLASVASAIATSINFIRSQVGDEQPFTAVAIGTEVVVFARTTSQTWNRIRYSLFSTSPNMPFTLFSGATASPTSTYLPSPVAYSVPTSGLYVEGTFTGGNDNVFARAVVARDDADEVLEADAFVKTTSGYSRVSGYSMYLDQPVYDAKGRITGFTGYDKYFVVNLADTSQSFDLGQTHKIALYTYSPNTTGFLSVYPVRDFDFDFRSTYYARDADSTPSLLHGWYTSPTGASAVPAFDYTTLNPGSVQLIDSIVGPTSAFVLDGGFQGLLGIVDELSDSTLPVTNEYDRLRENSLPVLSLSSRVVPFIHKWVYDDLGVDVRENAYRLNVDQAFGYASFSPSFDHFDRDRRFFTHEWLYLQEYPPYMSFREKANSFSYFDDELYFPAIPLADDPSFAALCAGLTSGTGASAGLLSVAEDYFVRYFTRETVDDVPVPRDFRYALLAYGSTTKHPECMFRGVKVEVRERAERSPIQWNKDNLRLLPSAKYNGYRFSAVMVFGRSGNQITFVKNDVWKSVTMVVEVEADSQLLSYVGATGSTGRFLDRSSLYTLQHKLVVAGGSASYADRDISGGIVNWVDNGDDFTVIGGSSISGVFPNLAAEVSLNQNGSYNNIQASGATYSFLFEDIYDLTTTTFKCRRIYSTTFAVNPLTPDGTRSLYPQIFYGMWAGVYWLRDDYVYDMRDTLRYLGGGYNAYTSLFNSVSFAELALRVNRGDPSVKYVNVTEAGTVEYDSFVVELVRPDVLMKGSYVQPRKIQNKPIDLQNSTEPIGYELAALPRTGISEVVRYRGGYAPKVLDVLSFVDGPTFSADGIDYLNVEFFVGTEAVGRTFGSVGNLYFNKVNTVNPNIILSYGGDAERVLPDIGEIAIDYADHYVARSSWDPYYYRRYLKKNVWEPVLGTREPAEFKSFLGSKCISVPGEIRIEQFAGGIVTLASVGTVAQASAVASNVVLDDKAVGSKRVLEINVLVASALERWLIDDGFGSEFAKYIDPDYSFGAGGVDDDVRMYIRENITDRYFVKDVLFFERQLVGGQTAPQLELTLDDTTKLRSGYVPSKNFTTMPLSQDGLDLKLIHNVPSDRRTSIAFTIVLSKK